MYARRHRYNEGIAMFKYLTSQEAFRPTTEMEELWLCMGERQGQGSERTLLPLYSTTPDPGAAGGGRGWWRIGGGDLTIWELLEKWTVCWPTTAGV